MRRGERWVRTSVVAVVLAACGSGAIAREDLDGPHERWQGERPIAYVVKVEGTLRGEPVRRDVVINGDHSNRRSFAGGFTKDELAVDALFGMMVEAFDAGTSVDAEFDPALGYPTRLYIARRDGVPPTRLRLEDFRDLGVPQGCDGPDDSPTDLRAEPVDWLLFNTAVRWTDEAGCELRLDVIFLTPGPSHCGWERVEWLMVAPEVGEIMPLGPDGRPQYRAYIWDPEGLVREVDGIDRSEQIPVTNLPATTRDSGLRQGGAELWFDPSDHRSLYRVVGEIADRFVLDQGDRVLCA